MAVDPDTVLKASQEPEHEGLAAARPGAGTVGRAPDAGRRLARRARSPERGPPTLGAAGPRPGRPRRPGGGPGRPPSPPAHRTAPRPGRAPGGPARHHRRPHRSADHPPGAHRHPGPRPALDRRARLARKPSFRPTCPARRRGTRHPTRAGGTPTTWPTWRRFRRDRYEGQPAEHDRTDRGLGGPTRGSTTPTEYDRPDRPSGRNRLRPRGHGSWAPGPLPFPPPARRTALR